MVGSTVFSWTVTACVEPDSTLGKGSEAGKGGDGLSPEGLGRAGGRTKSFRDGRSLWKTGSANLPNTDEETRPRHCSSCPSRVPKAGKTEEAGSVPTVLPPARPGLGEQAAKTVLCPFSSLAVGTQGGAATLSPVQATSASSTHASPLSGLGEVLAVFSSIPAPSAFPPSPSALLRHSRAHPGMSVSL